MDELLFPLCDEGDLLVTRRRRAPALVEYHASLGFASESWSAPDECELAAAASVFAAQFKDELLGGPLTLAPYAVTRGVSAWERVAGIISWLPDLEVVKRVNSKTWSTELRTAVGPVEFGAIVRSTQELLHAGLSMLMSGPIVVKEPYGVSGVGSVRVSTHRQLRRITAYLARQEEAGQRVEFVMEPLLPVANSFSTHLDVSPAGSWRLVSIQAMATRRLRYAASYPASKGFVASLYGGEHFTMIGRIADRLAHEGYFGPVCVDSLVTADERVISLGEINARISMGRINVALERALARFGRQSYLTSIGLRGGPEVHVEGILQAFTQSGLLFGKDNRHGVIPLAGLTLPGPSQRRTGRLFCAVPYDGAVQSVYDIIRHATAVLGGLGLETHF